MSRIQKKKIKMNISSVISVLSILCLAGCATETKPQYTWVKSNADSQSNQYIIADGACTAEAYKAVPELPPTDCSKMKSGYAKGFCAGSQGNGSVSARSKVYDGCMLEKGWEKRLKK
ncbi:MAG: hypothetical protein PW788_10760 [Micavibrio sp.]|nr:hypothetical protein [Micavibrio sp.]